MPSDFEGSWRFGGWERWSHWPDPSSSNEWQECCIESEATRFNDLGKSQWSDCLVKFLPPFKKRCAKKKILRRTWPLTFPTNGELLSDPNSRNWLLVTSRRCPKVHAEWMTFSFRFLFVLGIFECHLLGRLGLEKNICFWNQNEKVETFF